MMSVHPLSHRLRSVTLLIWGVFFLGSWNAARTLAVTKQIEVLLTLAVKPDPRFQIIMAAMWAIIFWGLAWGVWRKRPFTQRALPILLTIYALFGLSIQRRFAHPLTNWQSWYLSLSLFVAAILITTWVLNRPAANSYFGKANAGREEQKEMVPKPAAAPFNEETHEPKD
jgi:hypothetical protein